MDPDLFKRVDIGLDENGELIYSKDGGRTARRVVSAQPQRLATIKSTDDVFAFSFAGRVASGDITGLQPASVAGYAVLGGCFNQTENFNIQPNVDWLVPIFVSTPITFDAIGAVLNTGEDGKKIRLAIYNCDNDGQPTTLVVQTDEIAIDTANNGSLVSDSVTETTLDPGMYVLAANTNASPDTVYFETPCLDWYSWDFAGTLSAFGRAMPVRTYGAFASTYSGGWAAADVEDGGTVDGASHPIVVHLTPA